MGDLRKFYNVLLILNNLYINLVQKWPFHQSYRLTEKFYIKSYVWSNAVIFPQTYSMPIKLMPVQQIDFAFIEILERYYFIWVGSTPSYPQLPSQGTPYWTASYLWTTGFDWPFIVDQELEQCHGVINNIFKL